MKCNKLKLKMADGVEVETIEDLRDHFDLIALLERYSSGELPEWLSVGYPNEAEKVRSLDRSTDDFEEKLCSIFQITFSLDEAVSSAREAAEQGNAEGQFRLGCYYMHGIGVEENKSLAVEWIRKAAEQGHVAAQYELGIDYMDGYGVAVDEPEGVRWIRAAAENGNIDAQVNMGVFYSGGIGVKVDAELDEFEEAIRWFKMAADAGSIEAKYWLGGTYWGKDDERSFYYFKTATENGYPVAKYYLALFYLNGKVVEKDEEKAIRMLREAAECSDVEASEVLENMGL